MVWISKKEKIRDISQAIMDAQRPIRILDSVKHDQEVIEEFKKSKYKSIPKLPENYYQNKGGAWDPKEKISELKTIRSTIQSTLGDDNPLGQLLESIVDEYVDVCQLINHRGKKEFHDYSKKLYGSPSDHLRSDHNTIFEMGQLLYGILGKINKTLEIPNSDKSITAEETVSILSERMKSYFGENVVDVQLSDGIVADAAAGGDKIKIKSQTLFSMRDIDIYEVHEGWVHVGTTLNGRSQPVAKWLSVGPPRCTSTQEGLAVLMEIFSFRTSVRRAQKINDRIMAIAKAEQGANLIEVFEYFRTEGYSEEDCLTSTFRIFRGAPLEGGAPFTKDISYCKGFVENYNFMRTAIRANRPYLIPFLFIGKVHVEDIPLLYRLHLEGIIEVPKHLPPQFRDINGIAVWMSFSSFFNKVDLKKVQQHYNQLFKKHL